MTTSKERKRKRKMHRAAGKAPGWVRDIAATKFDRKENLKFRDGKLGKFGAASDVRHIDPADYAAPAMTTK